MKERAYIDGKRQPVPSLNAAISALKAGRVVVVMDGAGVASEVTPKQWLRATLAKRRIKR